MRVWPDSTFRRNGSSTAKQGLASHCLIAGNYDSEIGHVTCLENTSEDKQVEAFKQVCDSQVNERLG